MDVDTIWSHIDRQRRELATFLSRFDADDWETPSLCTDWTVREVAGHAAFSPQYHWRDVPRLMMLGRLSMDRAIMLDGRRLARRSIAEIIERFDRPDDRRRHPPGMTALEPLTDILVHTQDILRPLGLPHPMPVDAAVTSAEKALTQGRTFGRPKLSDVRLRATDVAWQHGTGPEVRGPMQELLMLITGRAADVSLVEGDGVAQLRLGRGSATGLGGVPAG